MPKNVPSELGLHCLPDFYTHQQLVKWTNIWIRRTKSQLVPIFRLNMFILPEERNVEIISSCNVRVFNLIIPEYKSDEYIIQVALM